jgi:hypothetical protein
MGADEEVSKTVDALFTAVTARDEKLLTDCEQQLLAFKGAGKLPREASDYLGNIVSTARATRWESAVQSLYGFMRAQRREGAADRRHQKASPKSGKKSAERRGG